MWFRVPNQIYFNMNAVENLRNFPSRSTVIITNPRAGADRPRRHRPARASTADSGASDHHSRRRARHQDHRARRGGAELLQGRPDHRAGRRLGHRRGEDHEAEVRVAARRTWRNWPRRFSTSASAWCNTRSGEGQSLATDRDFDDQRNRQRGHAVRGDDRQGARHQSYARRLLAHARRGDRRSAVRHVDAEGADGRYRRRLPDARAGSWGFDLRVALHRFQRHAGDSAGLQVSARVPTRIRATKRRAP